jgi:hypothetical protein
MRFLIKSDIMNLKKLEVFEYMYEMYKIGIIINYDDALKHLKGEKNLMDILFAQSTTTGKNEMFDGYISVLSQDK